MILASSQSIFAQAPTSLDAMLRDAAYVLNRYDEATTGLDVAIDGWKIPDSLKRSLQDASHAVRRGVEREKPVLNSLLARNKVPTAELFDVYDELQMVASDLDATSSGFENFGDNEPAALELAKLSSKVRVLGANIGTVLRAQIASQEEQLATCSLLLKSSAHK